MFPCLIVFRNYIHNAQTYFYFQFSLQTTFEYHAKLESRNWVAHIIQADIGFVSKDFLLNAGTMFV